MYLKETCRINPYQLPFAWTDAMCQLIVSDEAIADAAEWSRGTSTKHI